MKPVFKILMLLFTSSSVLQHQNAAALTSTSLKEERKTDKTTVELCEVTNSPFLDHF